MNQYQVSVTEEEQKAFELEFHAKDLSPAAYSALVSSCVPTFIAGYRAAKKAVERDALKTKEQSEASAKLAADLDYPNAWDTAAYPNVESAAIEALDAANTEAKQAVKALKDARTPAPGLYTIDHMRDYANGVMTTRLNVVVGALEAKIGEYAQKAQSLWEEGCSRGSGNYAIASGVYSTVSSELEQIMANVKKLGGHSFQKRAAYWAKKCFGLHLATDLRERNQRFAEEALELVQACGMTRREALGAVKYVYGRPVGDKKQEVGGVYTTLAVLCQAHGIDMVGEGERDLLEIDNAETTERIRVKRQTKPDFGEDVSGLSEKQFIESLKALSPQLFGNLTNASKGLSYHGHELYALVKNALNS